MKLNIETKNAEKTLAELRGKLGSRTVRCDLIRVYEGVSADFDIQSELGNVFSLEALMELTDEYKPWQIRIY